MGEPEGFVAQLARASLDLNLAISNGQQGQIIRYLSMLAKWNRAYNLTSIPKQYWVPELIVDALVALPCMTESPVLDVGSGAGLPGIPLAIARPDIHFTLLDSNGKKARFIKQVAINLQISNLDVVQSRVEDFTAATGYALIVSRAYAELDVFLKSTQHLLAKQGQWLAWKGAKSRSELEKLSLPVKLIKAIEVELPGRPDHRYLLKIAQVQPEAAG